MVSVLAPDQVVRVMAWPETRCVLRQYVLLSQHLYSPRCINKYWQT